MPPEAKFVYVPTGQYVLREDIDAKVCGEACVACRAAFYCSLHFRSSTTLSWPPVRAASIPWRMLSRLNAFLV